MTAKRKLLGITAAVVLSVLGMALGTSLAMAHDLWDSCRKTSDLCYYPGDCRSYIDTNDDGICDRSQPEPAAAAPVESTETTTETPVITADALPTMTPGSQAGKDASVPPESESAVATKDEPVPPMAAPDLDRYFLLPVLLGIAGVYGVTWMLSNRRIVSVKVHRRIWNVVLLIATVISALLGIYLILEIDFNMSVSLPFDPLFWHVEAGIAMGMIAVFHIAWHWRYFQKMLKRAGTEA